MATGDTLAVFLPTDNQPPATNPATPGLVNATPVLNFQDATPNLSAVFGGMMPQHYGGGDIDVHLRYAMDTATSGDTDWDFELERGLDGTDTVKSDSFGTLVSVDNTTVPGTAGVEDEIVSTHNTAGEKDSIVAGDRFRLRVTRDGISDGASGHGQVIVLELREG